MQNKSDISKSNNSQLDSRLNSLQNSIIQPNKQQKKGPLIPCDFNAKYFGSGFCTKQNVDYEQPELRQPLWQQILVVDPKINTKLSLQKYND